MSEFLKECKPGLAEAKAIAGAGEYDLIPVSMELFSDEITPVNLLRKLKKVSEHCFILESVENAEDNQKWGRYTFLGFSPKMEITASNGRTFLKKAGDESAIVTDENPNTVIQRILDLHRSPRLDFLPTFTGGLVGYFAYDYAKYSEKALCFAGEDEGEFNDVDLMLMDKIIAFDNFRQKIVIIVNMAVAAGDFEGEYRKAVQSLLDIERIIIEGEPCAHEPARLKSEFRGLFTREEYCSMVERAKNHIKEGDIFQAVLSNRFDADFEGSILDAYRVLRTINPSPYMFYFGSNNLEIAGASPETLVKLQDGDLFTYPLAGTRPRGSTDEEDSSLEKELLSDQKELSEHNMLVDLGRNDLGKISEFGSVKVDKYLQILRFSHVMHIGSTVSGKIRKDFTGLDAVNAVLPAGTLSGAPKIRAMQIINELEGNKRGIYGGAIGYLDFTGNMDTCIAIRVAYKRNGKVFVRSGAGIVAESVPDSEYNECINKSKAVVCALETAHKMGGAVLD